jgi:predicted dehydrogenase
MIATPAQLHTEMALEAIASRKHVFVEKPLALSLADGQKIVDAAASAGVQIFVGHVLLYHPAVRKMLSLVAEGVVGSVWHFRSRRLSLGKLRNHENVWWSFAPHDVALMLSIMKAVPRTVTASHGVALIPGLSDIAYADFGFSESRTAHIEVCWLDPEKSSRVDVFGTTGVLTLKDSRAGSSLSLALFKVVSDSSGAREIYKEPTKEIMFESGEPLRAEIEAFVEAIRTGRLAETSGETGLAVLQTLSMAAAALDRSPYADAAI